MANRPNLRLFSPLNVSGGHIVDLTTLQDDWKRSNTFFGGPWTGTFTIKGDQQLMETIFYNQLGSHFEEHYDGVLTWEGLIWEMDYVFVERGYSREPFGRRLRMSMDTLYNRVKVEWTDPFDNTSGTTAWQSDTASIAHFGRKDVVIRKTIASADALEAGQEFLQISAPASPDIVGFETVEEPFLEVTVVGYAMTAQYRFTDTADDSLTDVDTWIQDVIATDLEFITAGSIAVNARAIRQSLTSDTRAWDLLNDLLTLRDGTDNRFNLYFETGRVAHYRKWTNKPIGLFWNGRFMSTGFKDLQDEAWAVRPGIYRDMTVHGTAQTIQVSDDPFFESVGDFLMETVEVDAKGQIIPRLGEYEDEESLRTFEFKKKKKK